jgi:hypothetical protein
MSDADKTPAQGATVQGKDSPCAVQERARIRAAIEAMMSRHYDRYAAGFDSYDEGALDALDHALHAIDGKDTTHD